MKHSFSVFLGIIFLSLSFGNSALARIDQVIHFAAGKASLRETSKPILDDVISILKAVPSVILFWIEGHTDDREGKPDPTKLSLKRAQAVKDYMIQQGIDPGRLEIFGYGKERPVATNSTDEGRAKNRRVEFNVREEKSPYPPSPQLQLCQHDEWETVAKDGDSEKTEKPKHFNKRGIDGVLFKKWSICVGGCGRCCRAEKFWEPSVKDVLAAEKGIQECALKYGGSEVSKEAKRQYAGVLFENKKLLLVTILNRTQICKVEWSSKECSACGLHNPESSFLLYDMSDGQCYNFWKSIIEE